MYKHVRLKRLILTLIFSAVSVATAAPQGEVLAAPPQSPPIPPVIDTSPPEETPKLLFVHASIGEAWLGKYAGGLGSSSSNSGYSLMENNYFVSDYNVNYHNGTPGHDYCAWEDVFGDPNWMDLFLDYDDQEANYDRLANPGGQNDIIMIKPCGTQYPIYGEPDDPPGGECPETGSGWTVSEVKQAMLNTLDILRQYPDTFFVLVSAPAICYPGDYGCDSGYDPTYHGANARAVADWMVNDLLDNYDVGNVMVFDLYSALTSNHEGQGDTCPENDDESDAGLDTGNHHRIWDGQVQHQVGYDQNYSAYCSSHPVSGGLSKATQEFVPLLNMYYNAWLAGEGEVTAGFSAEPLSGEVPLSVQFTDTSSGDPTAWAWDFGDDSPVSYEEDPTHTYNDPGNYTVTLTVTGAVPTETHTVVKSSYISVSTPPLEADFIAEPRMGLAPLAVQFADRSAGGVLTYTWRFGDDRSASIPDPMHIYSVTGQYTVTLIVEHAYGSDVLTRTGYIHVVDVVYGMYLPMVIRD